MSESREYQQRTGRSMLSRRQRWLIAIGAPLIRGLARALLASCRLVEVRGQAHVDAWLATGRPALLCCWHQRLSYVTGWLLSRRSTGVRPGFLVSPSRDGELIAAVVGGLGADIVRGSANRTGARALRDTYATIKNGVSPIIAADGPHGPARIAKPGTPMLAQMTKTAMLPISFSADRYWQLKSWDRMIIPKPFARIVVSIGEPIEYQRGAENTTLARVLGERLDALTKDSAPERP